MVNLCLIYTRLLMTLLSARRRTNDKEQGVECVCVYIHAGTAEEKKSTLFYDWEDRWIKQLGWMGRNTRTGHVATRVRVTRYYKHTQDPRGQSHRCLQPANYSLQFQMSSFTKIETWTKKGIHQGNHAKNSSVWGFSCQVCEPSACSLPFISAALTYRQRSLCKGRKCSSSPRGGGGWGRIGL